MTSWTTRVGRWTTPRDLALAGALAVLGGVETYTATGAQAGLRTTLAVATVSGLAVRRRLPLTAAAVVAFGVTAESLLVESPDEVGVLLAIIVVAFSVAAYAPLRDAVVGHGLLAMSCTLSVSVDPSDSAANILPTLLLFLAVPGGIGLTVNRRTREVAALQLRADHLATEAAAAVDDERRRIARELHDVVSHAVTLIAVQAEAGQATIVSDPRAAQRSLAAIAQVSREALSELDRLLGLLRDQGTTPRAERGLALLPALVEGARAAGLTVTVEESGARRPLPPAADHCAYRVVQEGLTNALRHASGGAVTVRLHYGDDRVEVRVDSRGTRHTSAYGGTGRGLAGLRERVVGLGGSLDADPTADGAFVLRAALPAAAT